MYNTYEGMVEPEEMDQSSFGVVAIITYSDKKIQNSVGSDWCFFTS